MSSTKKSSIRKYLLFIIGSFFLFKLPFLTHYPMWDESVYLGIGKYIYSGGSSGLLEMIRPPGLPILTGAWWALGLNQIIVSRIVSLLFSAGIIIVIYLISKELSNATTGLIAAAMISASPLFFYYSDYILTDHPSAFFMLFAVYCIMQNKFTMAGIFSGIAFWFKFTHVLFLCALLIYFGITIFNRWKSKKILIVIALMCAFIAAYFCLNVISYGKYFGIVDGALRPFQDASAYQNNPYQNTTFNDMAGLVRYLFFYPLTITLYRYWGFLLFSAILFLPFILKKNKKKHMILLVVFLTYFLHATITPYKNERFAIFLMPFIAIYSAMSIVCLWKYRTRFQLVKKIVISLFVLASLATSVFYISHFYSWYNKSTPNLIIEQYFDIHGVKGPILTTDPRFAVFSNARYVGAYDVLNKNGLFINDWESNFDFQAAIFNEQSIPCLKNDARCKKKLYGLKKFIEKNFIRVDSYYYNEANISFYVKKQ